MTRFNKRITPCALLGRVIALLAITAFCGAALAPLAQAQTAGGTQIQNRASATYSDGSTSYSTVSNQVTVTVANVSGLVITPDDTTGGSNPAVVAGESNVSFSFVVTNTGNFSTQVRFLATGGSLQVFGPATLQAAVIDSNGNNVYDAGVDTDILGNASDVLSAAVARNASFNVIVLVNINAAAAPNDVVNVRLGDGAGDNQVVAPGDLATARVRTESGASAPVNGESQARGDASATVEADARLLVSLVNPPAGPVALGSNITYEWSVENTGQKAATFQTLTGAPAGSNTGVFVVAPIPVGTTFVSVTPPAGVTVLYSTSPLGADPGAGDPPASGPLSAAVLWMTAQPAPGLITRIAYNVGNSLGVGASVTNMQMVVQINTNINASNPIYQIGDAFARNSLNNPITDQSGDASSNKGDGNANFNEPRFGTEAATLTQGFQIPTTLLAAGNVLIGPSGAPDAVGPTSSNDDYTNKNVAAALIAGLGFGDSIGAQAIVDFTNTIRNTGNADDTYTLTAPTAPAGFAVDISTNGGTSFTTVSGGGSTTLAVNFGQDANIIVRVTAPAGTAVLNGFETVILARSANTNTSTNATINRLYTGFLRLQKTATIVGGGAAVPGADIEYTISYENISTSGDAANRAGGTNCVLLTASSIVITEDGNQAPNNWAANTTQVVGSATASRGTIAGDSAGSNVLSNSINTLAPGDTGTFVFRRKIN